MPVVVVESPAKAKTIEKYLGKDYKVFASFGHIRDIKQKKEAIDVNHDFSIDWEIDAKSKKHIKTIIDALKKDPELILATDPDREGEAISWHLKEILRKNHKSLKIKASKRITFTSITKDSVLNALQSPREVDQHLVDAYLARCTLDFLVGFNLSPILWSKFPAGTSAGRVQSVCLRIVSEREDEIENFQSKNFWTISGEFLNAKGKSFQSLLTHLDEKKLQQFSIKNEEEAQEIKKTILSKTSFEITSITSKENQINPPAPFSTATLQQEANRKLRLNSSDTMREAQKLYESGYITYMRTDAIDMAPEARNSCRGVVTQTFGQEFLVEKVRVYKNKAKNAQEAHECIRPSDFSLNPKKLQNSNISARGLKLYELIWNRTVATQMKAAIVRNKKVSIQSTDGKVEFLAEGQTPVFDGFKRLYKESSDEGKSDSDNGKDSLNKKLPQLSESSSIALNSVKVEKKETKPPPRFTEASLVKEMVKHGIGRPSTYSSIITTLKNREYIRVISGTNKLQSNITGRLVTAFLQLYFEKYVEYGFTAKMEEALDDVSGGREKLLNVLTNFWGEFSSNVEKVSGIERKEVSQQVANLVSGQFISQSNGKSKLLDCPSPKGCDGTLQLSVFKGSTPHFQCPKCKYYLPLDKEKKGVSRETKELGVKPDTNQKIYLKSGPYGLYLELEVIGKSKKKPQRISIPKGLNADDITYELSLEFFNLPRLIGKHTSDGKEIFGSFGWKGPYLRHNGNIVSIPGSNPLELFTIGINRAVDLLAEGKSNVGELIGTHPNGGEIYKLDGRYGPYLSWGGTNVSLPKNFDQSLLDVDQAVELFNKKKPSRNQKKEIKNLGEHPQKKGLIRVLDGPYGAYVNWGRINAPIKKEFVPEQLTLDQAITLLNKKQKK